MISIITEITRRKLFRYASNDCVCEFLSEPWEWLHEASSRVSDRIYICNRRKKREDKISLYLSADLSPVQKNLVRQLPHCLNGSYATGHMYSGIRSEARRPDVK